MNRVPAEHDPFQMFQNDAHEVLNARQKALQANRERNIRESGDEIEIPVREILSKRLITSTHIAHGHLLDMNWRLSPQLDFIVCDPALYPTWNLFQSGAAHILYDAVRLIGEIKTSYIRRRGVSDIQRFCDVLKTIKSKMSREPSFQEHKLGFKLGSGFSISADLDPYHNPLFSFILIADSNGFVFDDIRECYETTPLNLLPNVVCLLDRGCILHASLDLGAPGGLALRGINLVPEFDDQRAQKRDDVSGSGWVMLHPSDRSKVAGMNLAMLHALMVGFLRRTFLKPSNVDKALLSNFGHGGEMLTYKPVPVTKKVEPSSRRVL